MPTKPMLKRWLDLSPYGMKLMFLQLADRTPYIALHGGARHPESAKRLGFREARPGIWIRKAAEVSLKAVLTELPEARVVNLEAMSEVDAKAFLQSIFRSVRRQASTQAPSQGATQAQNQEKSQGTSQETGQETGQESARAVAEPRNAEAGSSTSRGPAADRKAGATTEQADEQERIDVILAQSSYLGRNSFGQKVYEGIDGRFVHHGERILREEDLGRSSPAVFLRAPDEASLALCADGFVEEIASHSGIHRIDDLKRWTKAALGDGAAASQAGLARAYGAIEGAMARRLARGGGGTMRDVFGRAIRLHEGNSYLAEISGELGDDQVFLPLPLAVVAQRLLGSEAELAGKSVTIPRVGSGALISHLPRNAGIQAFSPAPRRADASQHAQAKATANATAFLAANVIEGEPEYEGSDMVLAALPYGLLDAAEEKDGLALRRADFAEARRSLEARRPEGRSIFLLQGPRDEQETAEFEAFRRHLARRYAIEGSADLEGSLYAGRVGAPGMRILSVGPARPRALEEDEAPEAALRLRHISDFNTLWTWSAEVISARAKIADYLKGLEDQLAIEGGEEGELGENEFQAPYVSASRLGTPTTMVPRNLDGATREALARLVAKVEDIDAWVGRMLGMEQEEMAECLSPEQIDALGLAMDAMDCGRAFLVADQTGIGKGRILAALARRAAMEGRRVVFVTERGINISDFWRDISHVRSEGEFSPLILNDKVLVIDEESGETIMGSSPRAEVEAIMRSGTWPTDEDGYPTYNLVLATYSQFNGEPAPKLAEVPVEDPKTGEQRIEDHRSLKQAKAEWLASSMDDDVLLIIDESHNAAGASSNTGINFRRAVARAGDVVYSSATWAAQARNMAIYSRLFPDDLAVDDLAETMRKGGEVLQEVIAEMLVKDGVAIRREHDLSRAEYVSQMVSAERIARNREHTDALAPVLAAMAYLSGDIDQMVARLNRAAGHMAALFQDGNVANRARGMEITKQSFGSPLYNVSRLFVAALKVEEVAEAAVRGLREQNMKPIVLVENTVETLLQEMLDGDDEADGAPMPDFRALLHRVLNRLTRINRPFSAAIGAALAEQGYTEVMPHQRAQRVVDFVGLDPEARPTIVRAIGGDEPVDVRQLRQLLGTAHEGDRIVLYAKAGLTRAAIEFAANHAVEMHGGEDWPEHIDAAAHDPAFLRAVEEIRGMIDGLPVIPLSPLDLVRDRIEEAGYVVEEISGRQLEWRQGRIQRRPKDDRARIVNRFSNGATDALVVTVAGCTGISLHAGARFTDQRRRALLKLQAPADIKRDIQADGRVNRFDQVVDPQIVNFISGLPIEMRLDAMRNTKLRRMSANVTSNVDNASLIKDVPDLINAVGDLVISRYAEMRPELMLRLGLGDGREEEGQQAARPVAQDYANEDTADNQSFGNRFLSRLIMLPVAMQEQVIAEIEAEFEATVEELDAKGINPLKSRRVEGEVRVVGEFVFEPVNPERQGSVFHEAVVAREIEIEIEGEPARADVILRGVDSGHRMLAANTTDVFARRLERRREEILSRYLPVGMPNVADAIAAGNPKVILAAGNLDQLIETLKQVRPGCEVHLTNEDGLENWGVVTAIHTPQDGFEHLAVRYVLEIVSPGRSMPMEISLATLMRDENFRIEEGLNGENHDGVLAEFDNAAAGRRVRRRTTLEGNIFRAAELNTRHKLGSMVIYQDDGGVHHRALLVSGLYDRIDLLPVNLPFAEVAAAAIRNEGAQLRSSEDAGDKVRPLEIVRLERGDRVRLTLPSTRARAYTGFFESEAGQRLATIARAQGEARRRERRNADREQADQAEGGRRSRALTINLPLHGEEDGLSIESVLDDIYAGGLVLWTNGRHREWLAGWVAARFGDAAADARRADGADAPRDGGNDDVREPARDGRGEQAQENEMDEGDDERVLMRI